LLIHVWGWQPEASLDCGWVGTLRPEEMFPAWYDFAASGITLASVKNVPSLAKRFLAVNDYVVVEHAIGRIIVRG